MDLIEKICELLEITCKSNNKEVQKIYDQMIQRKFKEYGFDQNLLSTSKTNQIKTKEI